MPNYKRSSKRTGSKRPNKKSNRSDPHAPQTREPRQVVFTKTVDFNTPTDSKSFREQIAATIACGKSVQTMRDIKDYLHENASQIDKPTRDALADIVINILRSNIESMDATTSKSFDNYKKALDDLATYQHKIATCQYEIERATYEFNEKNILN